MERSRENLLNLSGLEGTIFSIFDTKTCNFKTAAVALTQVEIFYWLIFLKSETA